MENLQELSEGGRKSNEGGSSVENDSGVVEFSRSIAERNRVEINLPVGLSSKRDLGHLASVVVFVNATEHCLGLITFAVGSVAEVEGKDGFVKHALVDHVVEWRNDLVHGNRVIPKAKNTIESAEGEGQARLAGRLTKVLVLDLQIANLNSILGDESSNTSRAIRNLKGRAILLVSRRLRRVVLRVEIARDRAAFGGWNPEVGAASVENDFELLGRGADGDVREV